MGQAGLRAGESEQSSHAAAPRSTSGPCSGTSVRSLARQLNRGGGLRRTWRRLTAHAKLGLLNSQAQIAEVNNREAAMLRSRERKKRTGNAGDAGGADGQGRLESGTGSKQMAMMEKDVKEPATKTPHKNRVGQRERRRLAVRTRCLSSLLHLPVRMHQSLVVHSPPRRAMLTC